jgi:hypothetical protein
MKPKTSRWITVKQSLNFKKRHQERDHSIPRIFSRNLRCPLLSKFRTDAEFARTESQPQFLFSQQFADSVERCFGHNQELWVFQFAIEGAPADEFSRTTKLKFHFRKKLGKCDH